MENEPDRGGASNHQRTISGTRPRQPLPPPPVAGVDYPRDAREFYELFPDEPACLRALERLRWPEGFVCRQCGRQSEPFRSGRLIGCTRCGYLASVACDTLFHGSAKPLRLWLLALWEIVGQQAGMNTKSMQRMLRLRSERDAVSVIGRVQHAMATASRRPLRGPVEVAAIYVETRDEDARRAGATAPAVIAIAAERAVGRLGRARLQVLWPVDARTMTDFVVDSVAPRSVVYTGSWPGYHRLAQGDLTHVAPPVGGTRAAQPELRHVQRVADELRRWLWCTRGVTRVGLPCRLDEFAFRYDRRGPDRGLVFFHLLRQAVPVEQIAAPAARRRVGRSGTAG